MFKNLILEIWKWFAGNASWQCLFGDSCFLLDLCNGGFASVIFAIFLFFLFAKIGAATQSDISKLRMEFNARLDKIEEKFDTVIMLLAIIIGLLIIGLLFLMAIVF